MVCLDSSTRSSRHCSRRWRKYSSCSVLCIPRPDPDGSPWQDRATGVVGLVGHHLHLSRPWRGAGARGHHHLCPPGAWPAGAEGRQARARASRPGPAGAAVSFGAGRLATTGFGAGAGFQALATNRLLSGFGAARPRAASTLALPERVWRRGPRPVSPSVSFRRGPWPGRRWRRPSSRPSSPARR